MWSMIRTNKQSWFLLLLLALTELLEIANSNIVCSGKLSSEKNWSYLPLILDVWLTTDNFCRTRENWGEGRREKSAFPSPWWTKVFFCFPDRYSGHVFHHWENVHESLLGALNNNIVWTYILLYSSCFWYLCPGRY